MKLNESRSQKLDFLAAGESHKATLCFKNFKKKKQKGELGLTHTSSIDLYHPLPQPTGNEIWVVGLEVWPHGSKMEFSDGNRKCSRRTRSAVVGRDRKWSRGTGRGVMEPEVESWDRIESGVVKPEMQSWDRAGSGVVEPEVVLTQKSEAGPWNQKWIRATGPEVESWDGESWDRRWSHGNGRGAAWAVSGGGPSVEAAAQFEHCARAYLSLLQRALLQSQISLDTNLHFAATIFVAEAFSFLFLMRGCSTFATTELTFQRRN